MSCWNVLRANPSPQRRDAELRSSTRTSPQYSYFQGRYSRQYLELDSLSPVSKKQSSSVLHTVLFLYVKGSKLWRVTSRNQCNWPTENRYNKNGMKHKPVLFLKQSLSSSSNKQRNAKRYCSLKSAQHCCLAKYNHENMSTSQNIAGLLIIEFIIK